MMLPHVIINTQTANKIAAETKSSSSIDCHLVQPLKKRHTHPRQFQLMPAQVAEFMQGAVRGDVLVNIAMFVGASQPN